MSAPSSPAVARRRRLAVVIAALLALGVAGWMVTRSPLLDVDHVVVVGNGRLTADEILGASGITTGDAMVWLDASSAESAVESSPWVRTAAVVREWPGTVRISVQERAPVAWVDAGEGRALLVDREAHALTVEPVPPAGLPQLLSVAPAPVGAAVRPAGGARLAGHLTAEEAPGVRSIAVDRARATLVVASGQEVRFGRLDRFRDKMRAAFAVLAQPGVAARDYVDVSAPSTPVAG